MPKQKTSGENAIMMHSPPGFEPGSIGPEPIILDHCTIGLYLKIINELFLKLTLSQI